MNKIYFKIIFLLSFLFLIFESHAQISEYLLYTTDFNGSTNWNLGTKTNKWIINNQYSCAGTFTSNTPNNGTGNYLHVYSEASLSLYGGTCACHTSTSPSETIYANLTSALNTLGFDSVVVSFNWICGGNTTNFGFLQISNDGGQNYTTITNPRYYFNSQSSWTNIVIHSNHVPQLLNNPALVIRFGFTSGNSRSNPAFGIDNLAIKAFSTSSEFRTQVVDITNELCSNTSTGAARVLATGGQHPYSYQWYNISENQTITNNDSIISNLKPGNYRVIITDAINQSDTNYFVIQSIYPSPIITAGENDTTCYGESVGLTATGGVYYTWEPSSEIIGTNLIANPTASPDSTTTFIVTAKAPATNLINNGDFSANNTGFSSDYTFYTTYPGGPGGMNDGNYAVSNCPSDANSSWWECNGQDHTGGAGNMMIVNGASTAGVNIWCQTQEVMANTDYAFSTWLSTMHPQNPSILQFSINGQLLGSPFNASADICEWNQFYEIWNSQYNTIATICIVNMNTAISGNDFALDDIFFSPLCPGQDSTLIAISQPQAYAGNDTLSCDASAITLTASGGENYQWNTIPVSNTQQITVSPSVPSTYSVTVTDRHGCTDTDDVSVNLSSIPEINLGPDTVLCPGGSLTLNASHPQATGYLWNDSFTAPQRTIVASGTYSVTVFSDCGNVTDSISVTLSQSYNFGIFGDTTACEGTVVALSTNLDFDSYLWSTNETTDTIYVTSPGTYSISATDTNACTFSATHHLSVFPNPVFTLDDALVCNQTEHTIQGPTGTYNYAWSNGALTQNIMVNQSGQYSLTVTDENSCNSTQTANIDFGTITDISLGNDTVFCENIFTLVLTPGNNFTTYLWNTGQNTPSIQANQAGTYSVTVSDDVSCTANASISVSVLPLSPINLGEDISICNIESLILDAGLNIGNYQYTWSNGTQTSSTIVNQAGIYWVKYGDENCIVSDTIEVIGCPDIVVPNVFTPNGDGYNDRFIPEASAIENFVMKIYNRWGTLIFETTDYIEGWDGKINEKEVSDGVYYWIIQYQERFSDMGEKTLSGSVSVVR